MVQKLSEKGFVEYKRYGIITLTEKGKALGEFLLKRHNIIEKFLRSIGISDNLLIETELIEHNLSVDTLRSIDELNSFLKSILKFWKNSGDIKIKKQRNNTLNNTLRLISFYSGFIPASPWDIFFQWGQ